MNSPNPGRTEPSQTSVGWIGTGRMGAAMAARLADAGVDLAVWNRTPAKARPLEAHGASVCASISELRTRDVVFTTVAGPPDLEEVLLGDNGLLATDGAVPGIVVDCSTVSAESSQTIREACAERGVAFLAAPVSGNAQVVEAGQAGLVVSGPEETFTRVEPLLREIGTTVTYVGDGEASRLVKIAHNLFLGVVTQSLAEVTVLAEKGGVSRHAFLEFLNGSVLGSTFTRYKSPAFVNLDYTPTFTPPLLRKDFDLGLGAASDMDVPMPLAAITAALIQSVIGRGRTDEDFAVLLDQQAASSGMELTPEHVDVDDGLTTNGKAGES
ncbi:NAD(P)-dependent oxidoreductase [Actinobacteria bacterium YIM 96077]|uniref:NAD(P)-dependent oxidoreductase n=1 Tax=Phytoactinopolyspora halophila TaxID=1981511 RepID=A0A329QYN8_9ACTN|nr:NAD(P)-dependent oxidoreductase [Phytoactinopolyspora halophila]AYY13330.1 NAD(P)-dependent oxidoreductase [Actinobacteria bacterium YIM 96077]RAW17435.1 NAD(P)-dependent oxidoreductase [Phytoactinopolyspora halophila]